MISAVDTNILLDLVLPNKAFFSTLLRGLQESAKAGRLSICDVVYAEFLVCFKAREECDDFLTKTGIAVAALNHDACFLASRAWKDYRRQGGRRERMLPDFLIGAHAQVQANRLLSRDRGFYSSRFPDLTVVDPSR